MPLKKTKSLGEFGLIDLLARNISVDKTVLNGIGDDTAVIDVGNGNVLLLTTDMMVEGGHFTRQMSPELIGRKALACNISDIAAMGGVPKYALISLGVPSTLPVSVVTSIYDGINHLAKDFGVSIVGGDTIKSDKIIINIALTGECKKSDVVYRHGAKVGDLIFVTGQLGGSFKSGRHLSFVPRIKESQYLIRNFKPSSMMDISDGLAGDLNHICERSNVGAILYEEVIPSQPNVNLNEALTDGEDFELLFTLSPEKTLALSEQKDDFDFTCVGEIVDQKGITLIDVNNEEHAITNLGFKHF